MRLHTLLFIAAGLGAARPQLQVPSVCALEGVVVDADTKGPISRAWLVAARIGGSLNDYHAAMSDAAGRFSIADIAPGRYRIFSQHSGFILSEYGRLSAGAKGVAIELRAGEKRDDILLRMIATGAIAGTVLDGQRPAENVLIRVLRASYTNGERTFQVIDYAQTDDRGRYRTAGLAPGIYYASAVPMETPRIDGNSIVTPTVPANANNNQRERRSSPNVAASITATMFEKNVYIPMYYQNAPSVSSSSPINIRSSETAFVDFTIQRARTVNVTGRVVWVGGAESIGSSIRLKLTPSEQGSTSSNIPEVVIAPGPFLIPSVPPGEYCLTAMTDSPRRMSAVRLTVDRDDLAAPTIVVNAGVPVRGRISFEGSTRQNPAATVLVRLSGPDGFDWSYASRPQSDGSFSIPDVSPGNYRLRVIDQLRLPWVKSARFGIDDILDSKLRVEAGAQEKSLDIVVDDRTATLNAVVLDRAQRPVSGALVVLVPDSQQSHGSDVYMTATTDVVGQVHIEAVWPGTYRAFASEVIDGDAWHEPNVLATYIGLGLVTVLRASQTETITLHVTP